MVEIDATDRRILAVLQRNAKISHAELAQHIHLSPSACHRRVQRLEKEGVIAATVALLAPRKVGRQAIVFVEITLKSQSEETLEAFEKAALHVPELLECHLMAGSADYLLKLAVADSEDFADLHRRALSRLPGVAQMQSSFALRTVRQTTALPL